MEPKFCLEVSLESQMESKLRLETSLDSQVEPEKRPTCAKLGPRGAQEAPSWTEKASERARRAAEKQSKSICTAKTPEPRICTTLLHFWRFLKVLEDSLNDQVEPKLRPSFAQVGQVVLKLGQVRPS